MEKEDARIEKDALVAKMLDCHRGEVLLRPAPFAKSHRARIEPVGDHVHFFQGSCEGPSGLLILRDGAVENLRAESG